MGRRHSGAGRARRRCFGHGAHARSCEPGVAHVEEVGLLGPAGAKGSREVRVPSSEEHIDIVLKG